MTDNWFIEKYTPYSGLGFSVRERLHDQQSPFQRIEVFENADYGRVLTLDGCVMLTDRDEFVYHEMITHPAILTHPAPENVLIVGGGDGGTVREVCRHPEVKRVDLVEIDEAVIEVSRRFFPGLTTRLEDPRVTIRCMDGFEYMDAHQGAYDVIIVDSIDPVGEAAKLFTSSFYSKVHAGLRENGTAVFQTESPFFSSDVLARVLRLLRPHFSFVQPYLAFIPTYPSGMWSFTIASLRGNIMEQGLLRQPGFQGEMKYFTPEMFNSAFSLPNFIKTALAD
ncbi:MAG: polyamine aminopropyltransferase [Deltaproteobacteria bacterium]|nr:polyamine aminopropyltransferase [Deltaproteobacteria bacterium]